MNPHNKITFVRVFLQEQDKTLEKILSILHDEQQVAGVTVLRGIAGYGDSGEMHRSNLLSLSLNLPLVVEFFDQPEKALKAIESVRQLAHVEHIVSWPAEYHLNIDKE